MIKLCILLALASLCSSEVAVISEPIPGQEYVFVQTAESGAHPIFRKGKNVDAADRPFETAHKLPESLTYKQHEHEELAPVKVKETKGKVTKVKRQAAAPPGSIKIDPLKLIEKYSDDVKPIDAKELVEKYRSEIEATKATPTKSTTTKAPSTTRRSRTRSRTKKEAPVVATTPNSVLTTGAPATPRTLKIRDTAAVKDDKFSEGSTENKRSRIQIKKGPNGQEYEYEYVYYYYDDDDEDGGKAKVSNSHDGPARNSITGRGRHSSTTAHPEPAANEVVPSTRGTRGRGRQLNHEVPEEKVPEEKLPLNTRFPPRSRNINTTPASAEEEEEEAKTQRTRGRGRPQAQAQDNTADETQVSGRGRNRANVRRPSLELVDSASFNTHSSNDPAIEPYKEPKARGEKLKNAPAGPSFPSELPEGPVRFLGATPNEKMDLQDLKSRLADEETSTDSDGAVVTTEETGTTEMNAMDKVALDLYAILQGTQKLSGENEEGVTEIDSTTTESADTTDETTTEVVTTEEITTPTTTTTTTTTTPAPTTTTTTPEPVTGRSKFRGRPGPGGTRFKSSPSSTTSAPEPNSEKPKGRFGRPGFGSRPRPGARTTTEATESEVTKEEAKPVSNARPSVGGRNRFAGRGRTPASTTAAPESSDSTTASSGPRPGLTRPRPGSFNLRRRGGATTTTKEPSEESSGDASPSHEDAPSTTAKTPVRGRVNGNLGRPALRPGPRINLAARGRPGAATSTTAAPEAAAAEESTPEEVQPDTEEKTGETTLAPVGSKNSLNNLRNRPRLTVGPAVRPKQAGSSPVQVRRVNPLLRKKPVVTAEPSEAPTEPAAEAATEVAADEEAPSEAPSSTTEEPRGLNKLLAGRRRLVRPAANH